MDHEKILYLWSKIHDSHRKENITSRKWLPPSKLKPRYEATCVTMSTKTFGKLKLRIHLNAKGKWVIVTMFTCNDYPFPMLQIMRPTSLLAMMKVLTALKVDWDQVKLLPWLSCSSSIRTH